MFERPCSKFRRLTSDDRDGRLSDAERRFTESHRLSCASCKSFESQTACALDLLTASRFEIEVGDNFNARILRSVQVSSGKDSWRYWSPALIGAGVAGLL